MGRWVLILTIVALAMTAGAWAQTTPSPPGATTEQSQTMPSTQAMPQARVTPPETAQACPSVTQAIELKQAGTPTLPSEHTRCTATCATVMPYYQQKYATLTTHDGDTQCWDNCWAQFGDRSRTDVSVSDKKTLWSNRSPQFLRANQCAQTCWKKYNPQQQAVSVAGLTSMPRPIVAATMQAGNQVFLNQGIRIAAAPIVMTLPGPAVHRF